jgi:hypothetical protein
MVENIMRATETKHKIDLFHFCAASGNIVSKYLYRN